MFSVQQTLTQPRVSTICKQKIFLNQQNKRNKITTKNIHRQTKSHSLLHNLSVICGIDIL